MNLRILFLSVCLMAQLGCMGQGRFHVMKMGRNAVRIRYTLTEEGGPLQTLRGEGLPEWIYVDNCDDKSNDLDVKADPATGVVTVSDKKRGTLFSATKHRLDNGCASLTILSPRDEYLCGLGQFQDGHTNLRGLSRRLTQVNTQISVPLMLSDKGWGILWNNYGLTELNPGRDSVSLERQSEAGEREVVDVTSTEGGKKEVRQRNIFAATIDIAEEGDYALLLDVGQKMARRHNLCVDGQTVVEMQNLWLPPTASATVHLTAGRHELRAELSDGDNPVVFYRKNDNTTELCSPVADAVDYTVLVGMPDEIVGTYRKLTGAAPLMPRWALGYIHCRERFHSQDEILATAHRFRQEKLPVDVIVQDWQYWGRHGWNSMQFDEEHYPSPKQLTDSLHRMNVRLMLSVWSKIDKNSDVGKEMERQGFYIPQTDWIDFFNPQAAAAYWQNFSQRLLPTGIDAWWQDATEPENDDLAGRRVGNGLIDGNRVRNVYPLLVCKTVYEGLRKDQPQRRPMILTRSGFPGIQRYGAALWSGDVGNDWETFRRQITAGLGLQAAGIPWWTYDAGGFFRPRDQYHDKDYIERMLRWIETSVYLPLMRVHGYMSDTEPWNYGDEAKQYIAQCLSERYRLLPYIYSNAAAVAFEGSTLMRPLIFDFSQDRRALEQPHEYMFGRALLVNPITEPHVTSWKTYLPENTGGWYDYRTGKHLDGGQTVTAKASPRVSPLGGTEGGAGAVSPLPIPIYARGGSILVTGEQLQHSSDVQQSVITVHVYPGNDAQFVLYEDDGETNDYEHGECSRIPIQWNEQLGELTIGKREGTFVGMVKRRQFRVVLPDGWQTKVDYKGKTIHIKTRKK